MAGLSSTPHSGLAGLFACAGAMPQPRHTSCDAWHPNRRHHIVAQSTGCDRPEVSEAIYDYYSTGKAWYLAPGA